jgi:hypothetical protein
MGFAFQLKKNKTQMKVIRVRVLACFNKPKNSLLGERIQGEQNNGLKGFHPSVKFALCLTVAKNLIERDKKNLPRETVKTYRVR